MRTETNPTTSSDPGVHGRLYVRSEHPPRRPGRLVDCQLGGSLTKDQFTRSVGGASRFRPWTARSDERQPPGVLVAVVVLDGVVVVDRVVVVVGRVVVAGVGAVVVVGTEVGTAPG
jgi:hypothetical protein